jgi:hypothetical protein
LVPEYDTNSRPVEKDTEIKIKEEVMKLYK